MSLLGRLKSKVMGNPVIREFELGKQVASAGPGLLWKVHTGIKKSSRQEVSIFVFDKKAPEFDKLPKKQKEALYEMLKKGPSNLIKLRHPRLLTIEHQVEESGDTLAFVSEPVFASVSNLTGHYDNLPSPLPLVIKEHEFHPIEIQYGLMQLAEALNFLHSDAKMMHGNLTPHNVMVNSKGAWKIMGLNFCCYSHYQSEAQISFEFREWDTRKSVHTNPALDYLAPEYIMTKSCNTLSDIFSFGMLCYALYNGGKPLFENSNNMLSFKQNVEQVSRTPESALGGVPGEFRPLVRGMLTIEPTVRPDALQITKHPFFEELPISTLKYLDTLYMKKDIDKSQFFKKNLARVITKLPKRIVHERVLPPLSDEFRNHKMIPFVLPLVLLIAEDCTLVEYSSHILPVLAPAMAIQDPIQIPLIFLQKMDLLLKMTSQDEIQKNLLPLITRSLEAEHSQLQELCVNILPSFASMVDYSSMKHSIVPRITAICLTTREVSLLVKCLVCLGQMLDILDKHIVLDQILPVLHQISSREPGVLMAMLGIFHQTLTKPKLGLDKKVLAETVLPYLFPISIDPALNLKQFTQFIKVIREMISKLEAEQASHLEQLSKMDEQTKSTIEFAREVTEVKAQDDALNHLENMFSGTDMVEENPAPQGIAISGATADPVQGSGKENSNFLSGQVLGNISATFSRNSSFPISSTQTSTTSSPAMPMSSLFSTSRTSQPQQRTGYQPPSLQPQRTGGAPTMSSGGTNQSPMLQPQRAGGSSTMSSGGTNQSPMLQPQRTGGAPTMSSGGTNQSSMLQPQRAGGSSTMGSGGTNQSSMLQPQRAGGSSTMGSGGNASFGGTTNNKVIFSGITDNSQSTNLRQSQSGGGGGGGGGIFGGMSLNTGMSSQQTGMPSQQTRMSGMMGGFDQPLIPTQSGNPPINTETRTGGGWSSGSQSGTGMGYGQNMMMQGSQNQPQNLGWSSNGGMGSGSGNNEGSRSGWSQGQAGANMGMGQQQHGQAGGNMGMGQQQHGQAGGNMGMGQQQHGQAGGNMGMGQQQHGQAGGNMGMGQQQHGQAGGNMGMGQQQHGQAGGNMGMGQQQHGQAGGNMGMGQQQHGQGGANMGMGYQGNTGMGTGQQNTGLGMNWSSNIQPHPVGGSSSMMGTNNPPLVPFSREAGLGVVGGQGRNKPSPAPGANPFADLSFLS